MATMTNQDQALDKNQWIHKQLIYALYERATSAVVLSMFSAIFVILILWQSSHNTTELIVWFIFIELLLSIRLLIILQFKKNPPPDSELPKWERYYVQSLALTSFVWGVGLCYLLRNADLMSVIIGVLFLFTSAASGMSWYAPLRYLAMIFISFLTLPISMLLISSSHIQPILIGVMGIVAFISFSRTIQTLNNNLKLNAELTYDLNAGKSHAENIARIDELTGLNNRRAFFELTQPLVAHNQRMQLPISMILFDIDHFKKINDQHGHHIGDQILVAIASSAAKDIRKSDVLSRMGGEEFTLLLPNTSLESAVNIAEEMRQNIANLSFNDGQKIIKATASFGVASGEYNIDRLLKMADDAMYLAKNNGRNQIKKYQSAHI